MCSEVVLHAAHIYSTCTYVHSCWKNEIFGKSVPRCSKSLSIQGPINYWSLSPFAYVINKVKRMIFPCSFVSKESIAKETFRAETFGFMPTSEVP